MNVEEVRDYCLRLPFVTEGFPFGADVLVFKVGSKMFAYFPLSREGGALALKCDPDRAIQLRDRYRAVTPAWHSNKTHWNDIQLAQDLPDRQIYELIQHSYELVWAKLSKRERDALQASAP